MAITKQVTFVAKDENIEELKALLIEMIDTSKAEEGVIFYHIHQMKDKPTTFVVLESWESEEALEGHRHTAHYAHYKANFEQFTADKFSDELLDLV